MRAALLSIATATVIVAQSHPTWWTYASPDATALVGIQWENLRKSPFAYTVAAQLSSIGDLGFPDLECLKQARQIVLSAPPLLALETGTFPTAVLRAQTMSAGLRNVRYRNVTFWIPSNVDGLGVAQINEQLVLVGARKTLEAAIDNSLAETGRRYSPLLARAGRFSQTADLWVISTQLPDALASLFVPIEAETQNFEGAMRVRSGPDGQALDAQAWIEAGSDRRATEIAQQIRQKGLGVQVTSTAARVDVSLQLTSEQLSAALNLPPDKPPAESLPAVPQPAVAAAPRVAAKPAMVASTPAPAQEPVAAPFQAPPPPPGPQVIRIIGLDEGPKEIPFPDAPQPAK